MRPKNPVAWGRVDTATDDALSALRAATPDPAAVETALTTLTAVMADPRKAGTTSVLMTGVQIAALIAQVAQRRYVPWAYRLAVVLISIVGTLVTDNLVDNFGVSLVTTTWVFTLALGLTYIVTRPLGASFGDLLSQPGEYGGFGFGTIVTNALFLAAIAAIVMAMTLARGPAKPVV
jgi:uncharacterized membrane-anchored protein